MKRMRDVIGLPVICIENGKQVGEVKDVLFDEQWSVSAILLEAGFWFQEATCIEWKDLVAMGEDAVTIECEDVVKPLETDESCRLLLSGNNKIKGLPMITVNGHQLGTIEDVYLEENMGKTVIGYELTEGFISDLKEGRKWLPMPDYVKNGEDALIVPVHTTEALKEIFVPKNE